MNVALCFSGEFRTLDKIHKSVIFDNMNHVNLYKFVFLTKSIHIKGKIFRRGAHSREGSSIWEGVSDSVVYNTFKQMNATLVFYENISTTNLCRVKDSHQWWKIKQVYLMVEKYEKILKAKFDWLLRIRTDTFFFHSLPLFSNLNPAKIHVPFGMVNPSVRTNDHMAIIPRKLANKYFNEYDRICQNRRIIYTKFVIKIDIGYVILRPGIGATCSRLKNHKNTRHWWTDCINLSYNLPIYCTIGNTDYPNVNTIRSKHKQPLAVSNAPSCNELTGAARKYQTKYINMSWP